ncbi:MAG: hypothetical protein V1800_03580 [Candidatus Latescibacterota bacterium]
MLLSDPGTVGLSDEEKIARAQIRSTCPIGPLSNCPPAKGIEDRVAVRAELMTEFVRGARRVLDEIGREKGRHLALSIWAWPSSRDVWCGQTPMAEGLDFRSWIAEGLLDSFICQQGIDPEDLACCKRHGCQFVLFPGLGKPVFTTPETVTQAYRAGVDGIAIWDIDPDHPEGWAWMRRIGHQEEMATWEEHPSACRRIPLLTLGGLDAAQGLQPAVYSGG